MQDGGTGGTGGARISGRRRSWHVLGLVLSIAVALFFALAMLGGILGATGSASARLNSGETFGGDVALAIVSAVISGICIALAVHFEHRLRRHQPAAQTWTGVAGAAPIRFRPARRRAATRRYSPASAIFTVLLFLGLFGGLVAGTVVTHGEAGRSGRVQHHGIARTATVVTAKNHYHSTRGGGYYTADITVTFSPPVQGQTITVVRYPGRSHALPGDPQAILVDPDNPGYAEVPGSPSTKSWTWIMLLVFAVVVGIMGAFVIFVTVALWRHQRRVKATATAT